MYSAIEDVRREFKSLPRDGKVVITDSKIVEYQLQSFSIINSKIGTRYTTPVTGQTSVDQVDRVVITAVDNTNYVLLIISGGVSYNYSFLSGVSATEDQITDGLIALINADDNRMVEVDKISSTDFDISSKVLGLEYSISSTTSQVAITNTSTAILGDNSLRLLRTLEARMTSCKIAEVLRIKNEPVLNASKVRQDLKDGSCFDKVMGILDEIQNGTMSLGVAEIKTDGGGLASGNNDLGVVGFYEKGVNQW